MVIYICSAKSGDLEKDAKKFDRIESWLEQLGLSVVNPITFLESQEVQLQLAEKSTAIDKKLIEKYDEESRRWFIQTLSLLSHCVSQCDAVYLEYDWQDDAMSIMEYIFSQHFGLPSLMKINDQLEPVEVDVIDLTKSLPSLLPDLAGAVLTEYCDQDTDEDEGGGGEIGEQIGFCPETDAEADDFRTVTDLAASAKQNEMRRWLERQMNPGDVREEGGVNRKEKIDDDKA
ncbi:MAG: hypothetical protein WC473_03220 [Patescibacteria group bacterium]|jgi:hypothetical protein